MALTRRLSTRKPRISFGWLRKPPTPQDGNMTLFEHLRELRYRLVIASITILLGMILGLALNRVLFKLLLSPYNRAVRLAQVDRPELKPELVFSGLTSPFVTVFKISLLAGLIVTAPIWLYQIWAFIVPALLAKEKRWSMIVVGAATPLFLGGVALAYYTIPNGMAALIKFTPEGVGASNLQNVGDFLSFMIRVMLIFGIAFEIPLFIVMLNIVGVLPAKMISKYRSYLIFAMFLFAAVATPSPDAITMLLLAVPMAVLVVVAEVLSHILDRRKKRRIDSGDLDVGHSVSEDKALAALSATPVGDAPVKAAAVEPEPVAPAPAPARKTVTMGDALGLNRKRD